MGNCAAPNNKHKNLFLNNEKITFVPKSPYKLENEYDISTTVLGKGSFGKVIKVTHKSSKNKRALKIINLSNASESDREIILHEVLILSKLDHPNIIKVYEYFEDNDNLYIILELADGEELFE